MPRAIVRFLQASTLPTEPSMTYTADLSTIARIDADTYAVTLHSWSEPCETGRIRVYIRLRQHVLLDDASMPAIDAWREVAGLPSSHARREIAAACQVVKACWTTDDLGNGYFAYNPES